MAAPLCYDQGDNCVNFRGLQDFAEPENRRSFRRGIQGYGAGDRMEIMEYTDTIAAIATAMGNSGIGIVRISGENAVEVAEKVFRTPGKKKLSESESHTIHYGYVYDGDETVGRGTFDAYERTTELHSGRYRGDRLSRRHAGHETDP